jgi:hypothetical protein
LNADFAEKRGEEAMTRTMNVRRFPDRALWCFLGVAVLWVCWTAAVVGRDPSPPKAKVETFAQQELEGGKLPAVQLEGNYFSRGGRRFIPMGANWVPAAAAMEWPYEWNPN